MEEVVVVCILGFIGRGCRPVLVRLMWSEVSLVGGMCWTSRGSTLFEYLAWLRYALRWRRWCWWIAGYSKKYVEVVER